MLSGGLTWWFSHDPHEPEYICFVFVPVQFAGDQSVHRRKVRTTGSGQGAKERRRHTVCCCRPLRRSTATFMPSRAVPSALRLQRF